MKVSASDALLAMLALLLILPASAAPAAGGTDPIALVSDRDGDDGIYLINPDGGGLRRLVAGAGSPAWSSDGRLAYIANGRLIVASADGRRTVLVPRDAFEFAWSPDGRSILAVGESGMALIDTVTATSRVVTNEPQCDQTPRWAPDSRRFAFLHCTDDLDYELLVAQADGTLQSFGRGFDGFGQDPAWSPDGREVLAAPDDVSDPTRIGLLAVDVSTGARRMVLQDERWVPPAVWRPDGEEIAATIEDRENAFRLIVVSRDGTTRRTIASAAYIAQPSWSPSQTLIAFATRHDVAVVAANGSASAKTLTHAAHFGYTNSLPQWYPLTAATPPPAGTPVTEAVPPQSWQAGLALHTPARVAQLASDGPRVAIAYQYGGTAHCLDLWNPVARTVDTFVEGACDSQELSLDSLALANQRLAYVVRRETNHHDEELGVVSPRHPSPQSLYGDDGDTETITAIKGGGQLTAFQTRTSKETRIWRLGSRSGAVLARGSDTLLDARGATVATLSGKHTIRLFDTTKGTHWRFSWKDDLSSAALGDRGAIAIHAGNLIETLTPGANHQPKRESTALPAHATIVGFARGLVAAIDGRTIIVVRPADGRRTRLTPPGKRDVQASLSDAGLFFSYSSDARTGRVTFVPRDALIQGLR